MTTLSTPNDCCLLKRHRQMHFSFALFSRWAWVVILMLALNLHAAPDANPLDMKAVSITKTNTPPNYTEVETNRNGVLTVAECWATNAPEGKNGIVSFIQTPYGLEAGRVVCIDTNQILNWSDCFTNKGCFISQLQFSNGIVSMLVTNNGWNTAYWYAQISRSPDGINYGIVQVIPWPQVLNFNWFAYAETNEGPYLYKVDVVKCNRPEDAMYPSPPMD